MTENALNKKLWLLTPKEKEELVSVMESLKKQEEEDDVFPSLYIYEQVDIMHQKAIGLNHYVYNEEEKDKFKIKSELQDIAATCLRIIKRLE